MPSALNLASSVGWAASRNLCQIVSTLFFLLTIKTSQWCVPWLSGSGVETAFQRISEC